MPSNFFLSHTSLQSISVVFFSFNCCAYMQLLLVFYMLKWHFLFINPWIKLVAQKQLTITLESTFFITFMAVKFYNIWNFFLAFINSNNFQVWNFITQPCNFCLCNSGKLKELQMLGNYFYLTHYQLTFYSSHHSSFTQQNCVKHFHGMFSLSSYRQPHS